jgi:hypothetical protein
MSDHETYFDSLVGKRVIVIWHDAGNDWIAFKLLWEDCGNVKLQGVASPDGNRHDGSCVICPTTDIRDMIEWKHEQPTP